MPHQEDRDKGGRKCLSTLHQGISFSSRGRILRENYGEDSGQGKVTMVLKGLGTVLQAKQMMKLRLKPVNLIKETRWL